VKEYPVHFRLTAIPHTLPEEKMCHGHPYQHKCSHTSVKWLYCPDAQFDLETGYGSPCSRPVYSARQYSTASCPLQRCYFEELNGNWICCRCQDANTQGWCNNKVKAKQVNEYDHLGTIEWETCGHGCCEHCTENSKRLTQIGRKKIQLCRYLKL
jgi:hypothetical protein